MAPRELISLDFVEHDTVAALNYLLSLCEDNKIAGIVFAVALKHSRDHPHLCGSTGRLASDLVEAAGIGSMLSLKLTQEALERSLGAR